MKKIHVDVIIGNRHNKNDRKVLHETIDYFDLLHFMEDRYWHKVNPSHSNLKIKDVKITGVK